MSKKITFNPKPTAKTATSADSWVETRATVETSEGQEAEPQSETMKRLTFDIPENLHRRIKTQCASKGIKMTDELRLLLEKHFTDQVSQA